MKSTPLLMKGPLVRATLAGVKTETRRLITSLNGIGKISHLRPIDPGGYEWAYRNAWGVPCQLPVMPLYDSCPYGGPGDCLWVREMFSITELGEYVYGRQSYPKAIHRPAIHMPREACRLELELVSVSIEFVQNITDEAIRAEGVADLTLDELREFGITAQKINRILSYAYASTLHDWNNLTLIQRWRVLWDAINGHRPGASWSASPAVWRLKYTKVTT